VFDVVGRRVVTIHKGMLPQGTSQLAWNGRRQDGSRAPGGIYFYRLTLQDRVIHRQVVLLGTP
jgi:flagellar hook assembly protein FlgD